MISKTIARRLMIALFIISISVSVASASETGYSELMNQEYEESALVSSANPWTELPTKQQLEDVTGVCFNIPEDAENIRYRCLQDEGLAEVQFSRDGDEYCVRAVNQTEGRSEDISGLYYEWMDEETFSVDVAEKVAVEGKKRKELQVVTYTWRYEEPKYVKYDLKF